MEKLFIFKIGGKLLDNEAELRKFLQSFSQLNSPKILIHGGGLCADQWAERCGIPITMLEGRRITSPEMRDLVTMVFGGLLNKQVVAQLQALGSDAIGLSGADGRVLKGRRRSTEPIDFGFVGDIEEVRCEFLQLLIDRGMIPVLAPLSWDSSGEILNSNADEVACKVAGAFSKSYQIHLLYCFDKPGVLLDMNDRNSLLEKLERPAYEELKIRHQVKEGMLPKLDSCFLAKSLGAHKVLLANPENCLNYASGNEYKGTEIF